MSAKANTSKTKTTKKPAVSAKASAGAAKETAAPAKKSPKRAGAGPNKALYFVAGDYEPRITEKKPKASERVLEFTSFEAAKDQAVEQLIDLIDRCERRLWEIKRAENFEQYEKLAGSD